MKHGLLFVAAAIAACSPRPRALDDSGEERREPAADERRLVELDLSAGAPEGSGSGLVQLPATRTYTGLVRAIERATDDPLTAGLLVRFGATDFDFARSEELAELLGRARDKGIPVVCHAHGLSNATAWLASRGCSRIWLSAAGGVETVGIAATLVHLKPMLDRIKVQTDFLAIGRYKSGPEPLTRDAPSEATEESLKATLGSMRQSWIDGAAQGRPRASLGERLEQGPYPPEQAKALAIVDAIGFETDARNEARRLAKTNATATTFGSRAKGDSGIDIGEIVRILSGADQSTGGRPRIAVVPAEGAIGMQAGGPLDSGGISAEAMNRTLRRLRADDSVKAVVLRIDSPGGSPLASDLIWHELMRMRKKKPVVASVGGMAASGGYYIACGAHKIVADRTSIVGSIGVFGGKIVIGPALADVGINSFTIPASPAPGAAERAAYLSPFLPWDDATRDRVRSSMQSIYDLFIARVSEARKLPQDLVRQHAEGRIWSGAQGKERNLVDDIGGLAKALDLARKLGGLERDTPVSVEGSREGLLEMLFLGEDASESQIRAAIARLEGDRALLAHVPKRLRAHAASLMPLLSGERVVVALPIALAVD